MLLLRLVHRPAASGAAALRDNGRLEPGRARDTRPGEARRARLHRLLASDGPLSALWNGLARSARDHWPGPAATEAARPPAGWREVSATGGGLVLATGRAAGQTFGGSSALALVEGHARPARRSRPCRSEGWRMLERGSRPLLQGQQPTPRALGQPRSSWRRCRHQPTRANVVDTDPHTTTQTHTSLTASRNPRQHHTASKATRETQLGLGSHLV